MTIERLSGAASLIDVLDRILDKGIVIDASVRVSLVGIDRRAFPSTIADRQGIAAVAQLSCQTRSWNELLGSEPVKAPTNSSGL